MRYLPFLILAFLVSCSSEKARSTKIVIDNNKIDLSQQLDGEWDKVCILTPYSTNDYAKEIIGIEYDVEAISGVTVSDSISLLVTVKNGTAVGQYEVSRKNADFASLGAGCYTRANAQFEVKNTSNGWHQLKNT